MDDTTNKPEEGHDWQETWKKHLHQVDDKLIEIFKGFGGGVDDFTEHAKAKIHEMLDKTDMDEKARANWDKTKAEGKVIGAKIEGRIAHLIESGKITWSKMTKKEEAK